MINTITLIIGIIIGICLFYFTRMAYLAIDAHDERHAWHENEEERMLHLIIDNQREILAMRRYLFAEIGESDNN